MAAPMFARYTPQSRRAIYFACAAALDMAAPDIDSNHILRGLLVDKESRANKLFHLRELFPEDAVQQDKLKDRTIQSKAPPLNRDGSRLQPRRLINLRTIGSTLITLCWVSYMTNLAPQRRSLAE